MDTCHFLNCLKNTFLLLKVMGRLQTYRLFSFFVLTSLPRPTLHLSFFQIKKDQSVARVAMPNCHFIILMVYKTFFILFFSSNYIELLAFSKELKHFLFSYKNDTFLIINIITWCLNKIINILIFQIFFIGKSLSIKCLQNHQLLLKLSLKIFGFFQSVNFNYQGACPD